MNEGPKKSSSHNWLIRAIAMILVIALLGTVLLYRRSDVTLNFNTVEAIENKGGHAAGRQLLANNTYAGASRASRMSMFAQNMIGGEHSYDDYLLAAQISIADAKYDDAIGFTQRALDTYKGDAEGKAALQLQMGCLYTMNGDYEDALKWLDRGIAVNPSPEALTVRSQVRLNLGDVEGALEDAESALVDSNDPAGILPDLTNVYEASGNYEAALVLYDQLIERTGNANYLLNRAYCYTNLDRMEEAAADCERYAQVGGPEVGSAEVMLGLGWMRMGDYVKADDCFVRAVDAGYSDPESLYYYVVLCAYVTENYARACEYGDRLIASVLSGTTPELANMQLENTTGQLKVALAKMDLASLCLMTGASHVRMGDYDLAVDSLTACLNENGNAAYANYLRGSCLLAAEQFEAAIPDFDAAIAAEEELEKSHYGRGLCRLQLGDYDGALEDLDWVVLNGTNEALFEEASLLIDVMVAPAATSTPEVAPSAEPVTPPTAEPLPTSSDV